MTQPLMIVATEPGVGKSVVALGLLDHIQRQGVRACYFKPVSLGKGPDHTGRDAGLMHRALHLTIPPGAMSAMSSADVLGAVRGGHYDEVLDRIFERFCIGK